jgi:tRNA/rRNA methyltransferase
MLTPEAATLADSWAAGALGDRVRAGTFRGRADVLALARAIITVPINPEFASLNLAQAVILCAYEWSKGAAQTPGSPRGRICPLPRRRNWKG